MNVAEKLKEINLPDGSFVIVGSGILGALGIRESRDIDLIVSEEVYAQLDADGWDHDIWGDQQTVLKKDVFDLGKYWGSETLADLLKNAQYVDGLPYLSLDNVYKWKKSLGRKKDIIDLKLIEAYRANYQVA